MRKRARAHPAVHITFCIVISTFGATTDGGYYFFGEGCVTFPRVNCVYMPYTFIVFTAHLIHVSVVLPD